PTAVKQFGHKTVIGLQVRQNSPRFGRRQDYRKFSRAFDTLDVINEVEFSIEHLLVKKKQRSESLVLCGGSDMLFHGQMGKEFSDLALAHFVRMALMMKKDKAAYPIDVRLLGAD